MSDLQLKKAWEKRAAEKGSNINSVLFQGLPDSLNKYIHEFHWNIISRYFVAQIIPGGKVIDLGCGYGRLSTLIKNKRPDIEITGFDFSYNYCSMYRNNAGTAVVCGNLDRLPFTHNTFDGLLAVTSLMYIDIESRLKIFESIMNLLKPGGLAIFIDPGEEFKCLVAAIKPSTARQSTGGHGFTRKNYITLANHSHPEKKICGGMPGFTLMLPLLLLLERLPRIREYLLTGISGFDSLFYRFDWFTVHRWMVIEKTG